MPTIPINPEKLYPNTKFGTAASKPQAFFGYPVREKLFPGEDSYFAANKKVAGMAAEDGTIVFNPYAGPEVNLDAVGRNEAIRLYVREKGIKFDFDLTPSQKNAFQGTEYGKNPTALKESIVARILSNDPSAGDTTKQQLEAARKLLDELKSERGD